MLRKIASCIFAQSSKSTDIVPPPKQIQALFIWYSNTLNYSINCNTIQLFFCFEVRLSHNFAHNNSIIVGEEYKCCCIGVPYMDVLTRIANLREEKGWSLYQLANKAGLTYKTLYNWYNGDSVPTVKALEAVAEHWKFPYVNYLQQIKYLSLTKSCKNLFLSGKDSTVNKKRHNECYQYLSVKRSRYIVCSFNFFPNFLPFRAGSLAQRSRKSTGKIIAEK